MPDVTPALPRVAHLSMKVPVDLYRLIAQDAARLGVSLSDIARWRLASGSVPAMPLPRRKGDSDGR